MPKEKWRALTNPSSKEMEAQSVSIECIDPPKSGEGEGEGYIVTVCPKTPESKPGKTQKSPPYVYTNPIRRVFKTPADVISYLDKIL